MTPALDIALAIYQRPTLVGRARRQALPGGLDALIQLAASNAKVAEAGDAQGALHRAAAGFYVQQVLFAPGVDAWRTLGVEPGASREQVRRNYLALMRWLHPDRRCGTGWDGVYAARVTAAWRSVREHYSENMDDVKNPSLEM